MAFFYKRTCWLVFCAALSIAAAGQVIPGQSDKPENGAATPPVTDPLGRDTPSGTIYGFLQSAQSRNYSNASQYLQMTNAKRAAQGQELAVKLKEVMDRAFSGNLRRISDKPEGAIQDGVPVGRQRVGSLSAGDIEAELDLVRVTDSGGVRIWLISSETLAKVPDLYDRLQVHQIEAHLPKFLVAFEFLGMVVWQWLAVLLAAPLSAGLAWLLLRGLGLYRRLRPVRPPRSSSWPAISHPLWLIVGGTIYAACVRNLGLPLLHLHYYQLVMGVVFIAAWSWLFSRILQQIGLRIRQRAILAGRAGTGSLLLLGERVLKALIVVFAIFAILSSLGVNMTTALAGLGIGGIAVAFAAQKTLENLFGGVSLLADEVMRVGDVCRVGDRTGTVEDISLRSTRIRTPERTELSIPNGTLATINLENLSRRDKILFNTKLSLRAESSPDQLRYVLALTRRLFYEHPKVETDGARIRFIGYDTSAPSLEVFCYILTRDYADFLAIQEDLLLRIMDIVDASGTSLASPTRLLYLGRDSGMDQEKSAAISSEVQKWRQANKLPFPDFAPADISGFSNSLPYPRPDSALRSRK